MTIVGIDPGTTESALVEWDPESGSVVVSVIAPNEAILEKICYHAQYGVPVVIEMMSGYGMQAGHEVFETCYWIGRFFEASKVARGNKEGTHRLLRRDVKLHLCETVKATDKNIREALLIRFLEGTGTKKNPGPLWGVSKHGWAALAVAVAWWDTVGKQSLDNLQGDHFQRATNG